MLDLVDVRVCYSNGMTIGPINLRIASGTVVGLIGPNGAGKTSLLRAIAGLGNQVGKRTFNGNLLPNGVSKFLSFVEAEPVLAETMTVREFLNFDAAVRNLDCTTKELDLALECFGCDSFADQKLSDCSLGMRKRAALSTAWLGNPEIILLDEPLNGLDTMGILALKNAITKTLSLNEKHIKYVDSGAKCVGSEVKRMERMNRDAKYADSEAKTERVFEQEKYVYQNMRLPEQMMATQTTEYTSACTSMKSETGGHSAPIIIVASHILSFIQESCSRVLLLEQGKIGEEISPTDDLEQIFYERFIKTSNIQ